MILSLARLLNIRVEHLKTRNVSFCAQRLHFVFRILWTQIVMVKMSVLQSQVSVSKTKATRLIKIKSKSSFCRSVVTLSF